MIHKLLSTIALLSILASCGNDHFSGEFDSINTSDAVKGMFRNCAEDVSKHGLKSKLKYFSHDINSFWILNYTNAPLQDYNAYYKNWGHKNQLFHYEIDEMSMQVFPLCKDRASFYYKINMTYADSLGKQHDLHLLESGTVMKLNEKSEWEYLNGHVSVIKL